MRVVVIKHRSQLLAGSIGGKSVKDFRNSDGFEWVDEGIAGDDI